MTTLDRIDRKILRILQEDARISNADLAERVSLSPSPCWRRMRRLEADGVIRKYVTLLDSGAVGLGVNVFVQVRMDSNKEDVVRTFEADIQNHSEAMECYRMTGGSDYLVRVVVADIAAYEQFLSKVLVQIPGVAAVDSSFALKQIKYATALPLPDGDGG